MMRLKPYMQQDCSHIVCWLKLLRQYFQDLLHEPISQHIVEPDNCLEGSPFWLNMGGLDEIQDKSTRHLQRRAIYMFISCCICLSCNINDDKLQCSCKRENYLLGHKVQSCIVHCNCFGLSEISDWFQRCYLDKCSDSKPSTDFSLSFLQLYLEEVCIFIEMAYIAEQTCVLFYCNPFPHSIG
jgi:protein Lines